MGTISLEEYRKRRRRANEGLVEHSTKAAEPTKIVEVKENRGRKISVPAFYVDPNTPGIYRAWDDSPEAWAWKKITETRNATVIEAAAQILSRFNVSYEKLPAFMAAAGWGGYNDEHLEEFLAEHRKLVEAKAQRFS